MEDEPLFNVTVPAEAQGARALRHDLRRAVQPPLDDEAAGDLVLAVTEAFANVVRHAYPRGVRGTCRVRVVRHLDALEVAVEDDGRGVGASRALGDRPADESGRGFTVMRGLVDQLRCGPTPTGGTRVVMQKLLPLSATTDVHRLRDRGPMRAVVSNPALQRESDEARRRENRRRATGADEEHMESGRG